MDDLKIDFEALDNVKIDIDNSFEDTGIKLSEDDSSMLGVELLANSNSKADLTTTNDISGGYSSDEGSSKSIKIKNDSDKKNQYDFFDKNNGDILKLIPTEETNVKNQFRNNISTSLKQTFFLNTYGSLYAVNNQTMKISWFINLNQSNNLNRVY